MTMNPSLILATAAVAAIGAMIGSVIGLRLYFWWQDRPFRRK